VLPLADGDTESLVFDADDINPSLTLSFAVLVKEGATQNRGALRVKPFYGNAGLDFKLSVGVKTDFAIDL
jgi:hypothetical protein